MNLIDYYALSPLLILFATALLLILFETMNCGKSSFIASLGILLALYATFSAPVSENPLLTTWLTFDGYAQFFSAFFLIVGLLTCLIASPFFKEFAASRSEFYFFLIASLFGLILIASSADYLTIFIGLETLSISLYVLTGYVKTWQISSEASFKYFLLGSISSAFLLFGIALFYGATGTTQITALSQNTLFYAGISFITLSLLFKAAVIPFQIWAPDVYAGAPTPVTAFMAVGTKAGAFAALIRIFLLSYTDFDPLWHQVIAFLAYATLIFANLVAMRQVQLRRFFAYSGISHAGFLLIPLAAGSQDASFSICFYLIVYALATLGSFACLSIIDKTQNGTTINDLKGLFYTAPFNACLFTLCLTTLAGIPPTIGFFAKFYILKVGFEAGFYGLVIVGLLMTIFAAYYYLRMVSIMFTEKAEITPIQSRAATTAAVICFVAIIALSLFPEPLINYMLSINL